MQKIPVTIYIPSLKAVDPQIKEALEVICETISKENLIKVKDKCTKKGDKINSSLEKGLMLI